jgi:hypothetical protein
MKKRIFEKKYKGRKTEKTKVKQLRGKAKFKKIALKLIPEEIQKIEELKNTLMFTDIQEFIRTAIKEKILREEQRIKKITEPKTELSEEEIKRRIAEERELMEKYGEQLMKYALKILREKYEEDFIKFKSSIGESIAKEVASMDFKEFVESNLILLPAKEKLEKS